jgi:2-methylcitrate dehydratase PrpD
MEHTERIARFIVETRLADIPSPAIAVAKEAILDSIGVTLAGSQDDAGRIAGELAREEHPGDEATVFGTSLRSSASGAAFANGVSGHALDFDFSFAIGGQPMASLTAATFAAAEPRHASGGQVLEAYIIAFELAGKVVRTMPSHTEGGWHSTGTVGTLGSTAAACHLLGLDIEQTRMALGIASSMASGVAWNFGSMSKPLHAGLAARNGILAAKLAQRGFTANPAILEGPSGLFETYAQGDYDLDVLDNPGGAFEVATGIRYKAYPCGGLTHTAIDALLDMRQNEGFSANDIDHIDAGVTAGVANRIIYRIPETALQGKFSIPYILARAALHGEVVIDHFTEEAIREPAAVALAERITMRVDPELKDTGTISRPSRVQVFLKDGRQLFREVTAAKGTPVVPMSATELQAKFTSAASHGIPAERVPRVLELLLTLDAVADIQQVTALLAR